MSGKLLVEPLPQDLYHSGLRVPTFFTDRDPDLLQRAILRGIERMKVYKTLETWRRHYSVFYSRDSQLTATEVGPLFERPAKI